GGFGPTGSITFTLTAPDHNVVYTQTVTVSGDGSYSTTNGLPATEVGTYTWSASYSGDNNNNSTSDNGAHDTAAASKASPCLVSPGPAGGVLRPSFPTRRSSELGGFGPTGSITFTLTAPDHNVVYTQTVTVSGDGSYSTTNGLPATEVGTY